MDLGDLLRRLRRRADLSQRELADRAGVPQAAVARIESGRTADPRYRTVERLIRAAGGRVRFDAGPAGDDGRPPHVPPVPHGKLRDRAGRRYPAHLDVWEVHEPRDWPGAWWAEWYTLPPKRWPLQLPPATYRLNRDYRDRGREGDRIRRSVRVRRVTGPTVPTTAWRFVAELPGGDLVGELRAHEQSPHLRWGGEECPGEREVVLDGVLVAAERRRLGIGRRLVEALLADVTSGGLACVRDGQLDHPVRRRVCVRALAQEPAITFLEACGFQLEPSRPAALRFERVVSAGQPPPR